MKVLVHREYVLFKTHVIEIPDDIDVGNPDIVYDAVVGVLSDPTVIPQYEPDWDSLAEGSPTIVEVQAMDKDGEAVEMPLWVYADDWPRKDEAPESGGVL